VTEFASHLGPSELKLRDANRIVEVIVGIIVYAVYTFTQFCWIGIEECELQSLVKAIHRTTLRFFHPISH
jgi:uncharacterized membrane protein (Fun14 family)